jgi:hypothetical protein
MQASKEKLQCFSNNLFTDDMCAAMFELTNQISESHGEELEWLPPPLAITDCSNETPLSIKLDSSLASHCNAK